MLFMQHWGNPPRGICGSGVIDKEAQLYLTGMIDIRGNLMQTNVDEWL
jgi:uncharacterized 2Fe-2S/4Fe-4S cluster protein (DUF4445 family)